MRWVFVSGEMASGPAARVSALDQGLLYGYGLFETMRSYRGHVFRLEEHYRRLCEGAALLALEVPLGVTALREAIAAVLERNELVDAYLRLTLTAGPVQGLTEVTEPSKPQVILFARELTDYPEALYRRGMTAVISAVRRNETSPLSRVKSLNCLDNLLAREEARRQGAQEAIMLNSQGFVAEGSASNVFVLRGGTLLTPSIRSGVLPGIARQVVLKLATAAGLEANETEIEPAALFDAAEVFLTSSIKEVMPLTELDMRPVGSGRPGPVSERLHRLYREMALQEASASGAGVGESASPGPR
jgi:branched-chain amino acid aminotransferase